MYSMEKKLAKNDEDAAQTVQLVADAFSLIVRNFVSVGQPRHQRQLAVVLSNFLHTLGMDVPLQKRTRLVRRLILRPAGQHGRAFFDAVFSRCAVVDDGDQPTATAQLSMLLLSALCRHAPDEVTVFKSEARRAIAVAVCRFKRHEKFLEVVAGLWHDFELVKPLLEEPDQALSSVLTRSFPSLKDAHKVLQSAERLQNWFVAMLMHPSGQLFATMSRELTRGDSPRFATRSDGSVRFPDAGTVNVSACLADVLGWSSKAAVSSRLTHTESSFVWLSAPSSTLIDSPVAAGSPGAAGAGAAGRTVLRQPFAEWKLASALCGNPQCTASVAEEFVQGLCFCSPPDVLMGDFLVNAAQLKTCSRCRLVSYCSVCCANPPKTPLLNLSLRTERMCGCRLGVVFACRPYSLFAGQAAHWRTHQLFCSSPVCVATTASTATLSWPRPSSSVKSVTVLYRRSATSIAKGDSKGETKGTEAWLEHTAQGTTATLTALATDSAYEACLRYESGAGDRADRTTVTVPFRTQPGPKPRLLADILAGSAWLKLIRGTATFSQDDKEYTPAASATNSDDADRGWAVHQAGLESLPEASAAWHLEGDFDAEMTKFLIISQHFNHRNGSHRMKHFRLSVCCDSKFALDGLPRGGNVSAGTWAPLRMVDYSAPHGITLDRSGDSILVTDGDDAPDKAVYVIKLALDSTERPHALRLDALKHKSMPHGGPGTHLSNGNFVLTCIRACFAKN